MKFLPILLLLVTAVLAKPHKKVNDSWIHSEPYVFIEQDNNRSIEYIDSATGDVSYYVENDQIIVTLWSRTDRVIYDSVFTLKSAIKFSKNNMNDACITYKHVLITNRNGTYLAGGDIPDESCSTIVPGTFGEVLKTFAVARYLRDSQLLNNDKYY